VSDAKRPPWESEAAIEMRYNSAQGKNWFLEVIENKGKRE